MSTEIKEIKDIEKMILREQDVLLRKAQETDKTDSGIYLPESMKKELPQIFKVISVGKEIKDLNKGDIILGISGEKLPVLTIKGIEYYIVMRHNIVFATSSENYGE